MIVTFEALQEGHFKSVSFLVKSFQRNHTIAFILLNCNFFFIISDFKQYNV